MADTHITGPTSDLTYGAIPGVRYKNHVYTSTGDIVVVNVVASTTNPVLVEAWFVVTTAYDGTTPTISIERNIGGTDTDILAASAVTEGTPGTYGPGSLVFTANGIVQIKVTIGGSPTAGAGIAIVRISGSGVVS